MNINEKLKELYSEKWGDLTEKSKSVESAYPFLIKVDNQYEKSDIKVMIVGQETDKWGGDFSKNVKPMEESIDYLMQKYYNRFYNSNIYEEEKKRPFFKSFKFFRVELKKYFSGKNISFLWNNISKIGKNSRGKPDCKIRELERGSFNILCEEFGILRPNLVIFTTGSRDTYIKHHFGSKSEFIPKLCFEDSGPLEDTKKVIAEVELEKFPEICAVRVQHPNRRALENSVILSVIKQCWETKR